MNRPAARHPGGMNHPVESARDRCDHRGDRGFVGDIGGHELKARAEVIGRYGQVGADHGATLGQ